VLVTHEDDIARNAHRIVRLRDGLIESDARQEPGTRPSQAAPPPPAAAADAGAPAEA
jgi:ABC-type sulfate/molybdate transport systems ATPase subunit